MADLAEDAEPRAKAQLARELNLQIREIAATLTDPSEETEELTFYCECGCMQERRLTLAAFDKVGGIAVIEGHVPWVEAR